MLIAVRQRSQCLRERPQEYLFLAEIGFFFDAQTSREHDHLNIQGGLLIRRSVNDL
jgi:hypothetical protein